MMLYLPLKLSKRQNVELSACTCSLSAVIPAAVTGMTSTRVRPSGITTVSPSSVTFLRMNLMSVRTDGAAARWMWVST